MVGGAAREIRVVGFQVSVCSVSYIRRNGAKTARHPPPAWSQAYVVAVGCVVAVSPQVATNSYLDSYQATNVPSYQGRQQPAERRRGTRHRAPSVA